MSRVPVRRRLRNAAREGEEARRAGKPRSANPYPSPYIGMGKQWLAGWMDEDANPRLDCLNPRDPRHGGVFT